MSKTKVKVIISYSFQINSEHYPKGYSVEQCMKMDEENFNNDPQACVDIGTECEDFKIKLERIK